MKKSREEHKTQARLEYRYTDVFFSCYLMLMYDVVCNLMWHIYDYSIKKVEKDIWIEDSKIFAENLQNLSWKIRELPPPVGAITTVE